MSASLRPTLYQAIISLLNKSEDLVVRIEAAMTLKTDILCDLMRQATAEFFCENTCIITIFFLMKNQEFVDNIYDQHS